MTKGDMKALLATGQSMISMSSIWALDCPGGCLISSTYLPTCKCWHWRCCHELISTRMVHVWWWCGSINTAERVHSIKCHVHNDGGVRPLWQINEHITAVKPLVMTFSWPSVRHQQEATHLQLCCTYIQHPPNPTFVIHLSGWKIKIKPTYMQKKIRWRYGFKPMLHVFIERGWSMHRLLVTRLHSVLRLLF